MQYGVLTELWQQLTGWTYSYQVWPGRIDTLQRLPVGGVYR